MSAAKKTTKAAEPEQPKRTVRLTYGTRKDKQTQQTVGVFFATTQVGNKELRAEGASEQEAINALKARVESYEKISNEKQGFPRSVEVAW